MAKKLNPLCTISGQKRIAMERGWKELKQMEKEGIATIDKFGAVMAKHYKETKQEGLKLIREGKQFIEVGE